MSLIQRAQDILLKPKDTWPVIAAEKADTASIYSGWLVYLAAVPAIAAFIGLSVIGFGAFGFGMRLPIGWGLVQMVLGYALSLVAVYVLALIVDALAPVFGGTKDRIAALKVVAYGSTAGFLGGIFNLLPTLGVLGVVAAVYSIYLIYTGLPVLMKCLPDKSAAYTAVTIVCGVVVMVLLSWVTATLMPTHGGMTIKTPNGEVDISTGKMEEMGRKMEEAAKRMEQAQKSGDGAAAGKAMGEMLGALTGTAGTPIAAQELKALLPETLAGLERRSFEAQSGEAMGIAGSSANAIYGSGDKRVALSVNDMGGIGAMGALAAWANITVDRETDGRVEKVYKQGGRTVREEYRKDGSSAEYMVILENGILVEAKGRGLDPAALKQAAEGLNLAKIEAMKRAAQP